MSSLNEIMSSIPASLGMKQEDKREITQALQRLAAVTGLQEGRFFIQSAEDFLSLGVKLGPHSHYSFSVINDGKKMTLSIWDNASFARGSYKKVSRAAQIAFRQPDARWVEAVAKDFSCQSVDENFGDLERGYAVQRELDEEGAVDVPTVLTPFMYLDADKKRGVYLEEAGGEEVSLKSQVALQRNLQQAIDICKTLEYIHDKKGWIHSDLKGHNVMVDEKGFIRVIDWDLAQPMTRRNSNFRLAALDSRSPYWSPARSSAFYNESEGNVEYTKLGETDIWSLIAMFGYNSTTMTNDPETIERLFDGFISQTNCPKEKEVFSKLKIYFKQIVNNSIENWQKSHFTFYSAKQVRVYLETCLQYLRGERSDLPHPNMCPQHFVQTIPTATPIPKVVFQRPTDSSLLKKPEFFRHTIPFMKRKQEKVMKAQAVVRGVLTRWKQHPSTRPSNRRASPVSR